MTTLPVRPSDAAETGYQRLVTDIYPRLAEQVLQRYQANTGKSLLDVYNLDPAFLEVEPGTLAFVMAHRPEMAAILGQPELADSLVRLFVISTLEFTYANNQFIHLDRTEENSLYRIYREYLDAMRHSLADEAPAEVMRERLRSVIASHFTALRANLSRFLDHPEARDLDEQMIFRRVVCREYSPAFQLEILGISLDALEAPVLDLGCGKAGRLVQYLNQHAIRAVGVDRIVEARPDLQSADWLTLRLEPEGWGTVLSHMAFSNHFTFHHLYRSGRPEPYARQYRAILGGLRPGGSFFYAPGLPFIEDVLPKERYRVIRRPVCLSGQAAVEEAVTGGAVFASRVLKL